MVNMNESFALGDEGIHRYQERLCVPDVDDLRTRIIEWPMVPYIPYIKVPPRCIIILSRSIGGMA